MLLQVILFYNRLPGATTGCPSDSAANGANLSTGVTQGNWELLRLGSSGWKNHTDLALAPLCLGAD